MLNKLKEPEAIKHNHELKFDIGNSRNGVKSEPPLAGQQWPETIVE
jgi:hypothetical protein